MNYILKLNDLFSSFVKLCSNVEGDVLEFWLFKFFFFYFFFINYCGYRLMFVRLKRINI